MRLEAVRIKAFRSIKDTDWVNLNPLTGLVGENESGKTSFLLAISRLDPNSDFEDGDISSFSEEKPEVCARFRLNDDEYRALQKAAGCTFPERALNLTKTYDCRYNATIGQVLVFSDAAKESLRLDGVPEAATEWRGITRENEQEVVEELRTTLGLTAALSKNEEADDDQEEGTTPTATVTSADATAQSLVKEILYRFTLKYDTPADQLEMVQKQLRKLTEIGALTQEQRDTFKDSFTAALEQEFKDHTDTPAEIIAACLPRFLYFDKYDILHGEYTQDQLGKLDENATVHKLLRLGKLDLERVFAAKESAREQISDKAQAVVKGLLNEHWKQKDIRVRFRFGEQEGTKLLTLLVQSENSISIPFEQRSDGFKWFLSFYAAFNDANLDLENTVLLLDDPAVSLHAKGQKDAYSAFERLAGKSNVIVFTTHSPFLVDLGNLHRYRIAENKDEINEGTRIRFPFTEVAETPMQPILAAMGCPIGSTFLPKSRFVVPEGPIDYYLLHAMLGIATRNSPLHPSIGIAPAKNAGDVMILTVLYQSLDMESVGLLDGDSAGLQVIESAKGKGLDKLIRLTTTKELLGVEYMEAIFDYATYASAAADVHGLNAQAKAKLAADVPADSNYKKHMQGYFTRHKLGRFSGLDTAACLANQYDPLAESGVFPTPDLVNKAHSIVEAVHKLFKVK